VGLQAVIAGELDGYATDHPQLDFAVMRSAREILAALCMEGICESASRYVRLQQSEAASRVRDLEASLSALQSLEDDRATLLRETAHDLRGSVSVIASASALLAKPTVQQEQREHFNDLLQQRIRSTGSLLADRPRPYRRVRESASRSSSACAKCSAPPWNWNQLPGKGRRFASSCP
jgi:hypothetical protein